MNDELKELVLNDSVPASLVGDFCRKIKALKDKAEKLNSAMNKAQSFSESLGLTGRMFLIQEERTKAEEDFVKEARKYLKKGGADDEEK